MCQKLSLQHLVKREVFLAGLHSVHDLDFQKCSGDPWNVYGFSNNRAEESREVNHVEEGDHERTRSAALPPSTTLYTGCGGWVQRTHTGRSIAHAARWTSDLVPYEAHQRVISTGHQVCPVR